MDRAETEAVLREYHAPLVRLCRVYHSEPADAEDLYQEIAVSLWRSAAGFRGDSSIRTWFYRVAHNTAITHKRKWWRRARATGDLNPAMHEDHSVRPDDRLIEAARAAALRKAILELPLEDRQLVALHLEGVSLNEMEAVTGVRAGTLATRLSRLRTRLAAALSPKEARP